MEAYGMTDVGIERDVNQDALFYSTVSVGPLQNLFMVCDGMGGHAAGDFASRFTIENLVGLIKDAKGGQLITTIDTAIKNVNDRLVRHADENLDMYGMGTTLVLATIEDGILYVANVGDSRLYLIDDDIRQITRDHSYVEEMVKAGKMKRGSIEYNTRRNMITRAIGSPTGVVADYFEIELSKGAKLLLCSDGLTNMLSNDEIFSIVKSRTALENRVRTLIGAANINGGTDNISALIVEL